jgi:hypothetical protein
MLELCSHSVFSRHGFVQKIVSFTKNGVGQAFVQFQVRASFLLAN